MTYVGELISIGVAFSWTATALLSEYGSKRLGNLTLNVLRMALTLLLSVGMFAVVGQASLTTGATAEAYGWMMLSGLVGYVIGDYCLFQSYIIIGSHYGQLFMTLAPLSAALMAWITLGQQMTWTSMVAMMVTLTGIGISVLGRSEHHRVGLRLPLHGVLFAVGAALCQGIGLVLSKIGMEHYDTTELPAWLVPFSANAVRCVAGCAGFTLLLLWREGVKPLREALHDRKGMGTAMAIAIFGPFVGVGFSLMAVQYTDAGIASTLMALTPVIIILPAHWLFKQPITWRTVTGAVISVMGVALFFTE